MSADPGAVRLEIRGTTAFITFDRPAARNAMTWAMYDQLDRALDRLGTENAVRVAVLRGAGGSFVAGTDIAQFREFTTGTDGVAYERRIDTILAKLESVRVATVGVIDGYAAGAGLVLAAACDLRVCTPNARFGVPIAKTVGNCLSMGNYARLAAHVGVSRATALLFTADFMSAQEARAKDFVMAVVEPEHLDTYVAELCQRLAAHAPITLQITKEAMRRMVAAMTVEGDDLVRRAYDSRDFREGVSAFLEKRPARWEGE
jgi:enoyl-CoA hydratase/carnithine racemase